MPPPSTRSNSPMPELTRAASAPSTRSYGFGLPPLSASTPVVPPQDGLVASHAAGGGGPCDQGGVHAHGAAPVRAAALHHQPAVIAHGPGARGAARVAEGEGRDGRGPRRHPAPAIRHGRAGG